MVINGDIVGSVNYLIKTTDGEPAWLKTSKHSVYVIANYGQESTDVTIHDLRGKENTVNIDTNALEVVKYEGSIQEEFEDDSEIQRAHYEEMADIVKKHLGASHVIFYHHVFRARGKPRTVDQCNDHHRNPGFLIHCDTDGAGARKKIKQLFNEEEATKIMQNRYAAFNVWRPLGPNPITDKPLAICDYRSLNVEKDIHPLTVHGSGNTSTAGTISPSITNSHQWYYLSQMRSNEMFLFKMFDSKPDAAQTAFHTAFINKNVPSTNVDEKSLEMRCLVLYDHP